MSRDPRIGQSSDQAISVGRAAATTLRNHPASKAYYQKKRAQGKEPNAAVICLTQRPWDVIYAMLKHGALNEDKPAQAA